MLEALTQGLNRYGAEVENFLDVYLRTPHLPKHDVARALIARANARKTTGDSLLAKARQGMSDKVLVVVPWIMLLCTIVFTMQFGDASLHCSGVNLGPSNYLSPLCNLNMPLN